MRDTLVHRGPDDCGAWVDPAAGVALGSRRLAILDLSPAGHQPMVSASGRWVLAYNGEVYDHARLAERLRAGGWQARRTSGSPVATSARPPRKVTPLLDTPHSRLAAERLRAAGYEVAAAADDAALASLPDEKLLRSATRAGQAVDTENARDFDCILRAWAVTGAHHVGVVFTQTASNGTSKTQLAAATSSPGRRETPLPASLAVVIARLEDLDDFCVVGPVDETVLVVDAAGPVPRQVAFEWLRFADAGERIALDVSGQACDPRRHPPVGAEPVHEVVPRVGVEVDASHYSPARPWSSSRVFTTAPRPDLSRSRASMSRRALAGDRSK